MTVNSDAASVGHRRRLLMRFPNSLPLLRSGELTWDKLDDVYLGCRHVSIHYNSVTVTVPSSKTERFHNGVSILFSSTFSFSSSA